MDEKEFDFEHLTKEQALYLHRKLWNTLADKILEWKRPVEKLEIFRLYGWDRDTYANCWCCAYDNLFPGPCCHCPIDWGNFAGVCDWIGSPYKKWRERMDVCRTKSRKFRLSICELKELSKYAREVANMPERK